MFQSPGFDEGLWLVLLNRNLRFCATCIGETIRSCWMQQNHKNHIVLSPENFRYMENDSVCFERFGQIH